MRRVAIVLELVEDEAAIALEALKDTPIRFGGLSLGELITNLSAATFPQTDEQSAMLVYVSDGIRSAGHKPYRWSAEPVG
jgi:hypothetical protein